MRPSSARMPICALLDVADVGALSNLGDPADLRNWPTSAR